MHSRILHWIFSVTLVTPLLLTAQQSQMRQASENFGNLPLIFEANQGQTDSDVRFLSRGEGYTAFLTADSLTLSLHSSVVVGSGKSASDSNTDKSLNLPQSTILKLKLLNTLKNTDIEGEGPQSGTVNYFFGSNPAMWHTHVPTYGQVRYNNIYPGIDLLYHGSHRQLEYDFDVRAGADPNKIQFEVQGASQIKVDAQGSLLVKLENGELRLQCPVVYQLTQGRRVVVDGSYVVKDSTHIAFEVPNYDSSKALVIDPVLVFATYLGGTGTNQASGIVVDSTGSVYLTGSTTSVDFPGATLGSLAQDTSHAFVTKLNASGTALIYSDYIGGNNVDTGVALVLDSENEVYVTGSTQSSNFPVLNAYQSQQPGPNTGFLTKLSADGSSVLYSTYLGGNTFDQPSSIAIDSLGEVHVAGYTQSLNFPVVNAYQSSALANQNSAYGTYGFLTAFSTDGSTLVYSTYFAGNLNGTQSNPNNRKIRPFPDRGGAPAPYSSISAMAVDANGNAYVTGTTNTYNFPTTTGAYLTSNTTPANSDVGFVSKFNSSGNLAYSTYFYASSGDMVAIAAIAVDSTGSAYIAGSATSDGTFPVTTTSICDPEVYGTACGYAFVTKFDPAGATLLYSTFLGPNNYANPQAIALDSSDDAYVVSSTASSSFQTNNAIEAYTNQKDVLLVEIDPGATTQLFSTYVGGNGDETAGGVAVDASGNIYIAGSTGSTDFPVTQGAFQGQLTGSTTNAFVAKIGSSSTATLSLSPSVLQFIPLPVGSTSDPQQVQVRNMSNLTIALTSISSTGDFAESGNCGVSLPPAGSCTLSVTFTPTAGGARVGSIQSSDSAVGSPQFVALQGTGQGPNASLTPISLAFGGTPLGVSNTQTVTLTNSGTTALNIAHVQITGSFTQTNNCSTSLSAGSSCAFNVTFAPTVTGNQVGALTISDNLSASPQIVVLSGSGSDFSLTTSTNTTTVSAGSTASYTLTVTPMGGTFSSAITLSCSGAPANSTCSVSPSSMTPGSNTVQATVTILTAASSAEIQPMFPARHQPMYAVWFQGFGIFGMLLTGSKRAKSKYLALLMVLLIAPLLFMTACAGGTGIAPQTGDTAPGTYQVMVTGASGADHHSVPLTLIVQ